MVVLHASCPARPLGTDLQLCGIQCEHETRRPFLSLIIEALLVEGGRHFPRNAAEPAVLPGCWEDVKSAGSQHYTYPSSMSESPQTAAEPKRRVRSMISVADSSS